MRKSLLLNPSYWKVPVVIVIMLLTIVDGADKNCSVSWCPRGGGPDIQFPFWLKQDNSTSGEPGDDCGHLPGFRLACAVSDSLGRGGYGSYYKGDTLVEFERIVNTSIKGLQLSFKFKAVVSFIDYSSQSMYLYDTPFLTDIVPTYSVLTSSSSSSTLDALYGSYICSLPFGCSENYDDDLGYYYYCPYVQDYTFFNCSSSSSSAVIEYNSIWIVDSLSTADFKIFAYPSVKYDVISRLDKIRSCTKMYDLYTVQYLHSCKYPNQYYGVTYTLSWSRAVGGEKCKAVRETCKIYDDDDNQTSTYPDYFPPSPGGGGSDHATIKLVVTVLLPCIFLVVLGLVFLYHFKRLNKKRKEYQVKIKMFVDKKREEYEPKIQMFIENALNPTTYSYSYSDIKNVFLSKLLNKQREEDEMKIKMFMDNYKALKPTRYSYTDIKKITNMFRHKLGQGGYGSVFKGQISSELLVAVKVLHSDSRANGDDFINEVGTIGKIHHVNVVRLLGYCADGCNRALVYEFQPNHSLEKFVYRREEQNFIGWKKMQKIALGIAKGIIYLHQGCEQQILHFDIKPNNILLDKNFNPKISDFGLAKLCNKGQSIVSMTAARGTIGYIAPEVFSRNFGNVSSKSDVYSFGMLLLEMVGGKSNNVVGEQNTSEVYFPEWIFHRLEKGGELVIQIENEDDSKIARKLTIVGLWCIGWHPIDRPSMKLVIQMLEADECPAMPPNPFSSPTSTSATHAKSHPSERLDVISEAE